MDDYFLKICFYDYLLERKTKNNHLEYVMKSLKLKSLCLSSQNLSSHRHEDFWLEDPFE